MTPALAAGADRPISWGKAGVSLAEYRADAIACARFGANRDISGDPAAADVIAAERVLDRYLNVPSPADNDGPGLIRRRYRADQRLGELQDKLVGATAGCLTARGYRQFTLTGAQSKALGRLRPGTPARHAYLHSLASDPAVLAAQQTEPDG